MNSRSSSSCWLLAYIALSLHLLPPDPACYCLLLPHRSRSLLCYCLLLPALAGVSGAGRSAKESNLYCEIAEGINSYSVGKHRHMPEIEQGLTEAAGKEVQISFTPHLLNVSR